MFLQARQPARTALPRGKPRDVLKLSFQVTI